jgi:diguanylate cyclase
MVFKNIGELSIDDRWLRGQMDSLMAAAAPPLTLRRLEDVRARLKDVIFKQSEAKSQTVAAQDAIKRELAGFVERLTAMSASTSAFGGKIEQSTKKLESAERIEDIAPVLQEAIAAARTMTIDTLRTSDELKSMREKAHVAEEQVQRLQTELDKASAQARHDPLTGALNRKGLDEAMQREIASAKRKGTQLCLSLLDIDNFKKLNDSYGHDVGDVALQHLTKITRDCIRPQDTLARYGGEEFIVLLPDANMEQAIEAMTRVQRELTKHYFLAGKEKILITFSAGVAALGSDEAAELAVNRADQAMYLAKRSGKNRVVGA